MDAKSTLARSLRSPLQWIGAGLILLVLVLIAFEPARGPRYIHAPPVMLKVLSIGQVMLKYAADHNGKFPTGNSSTEIFQKLLDEKYTDDPGVFYFELPGKTPPTSKILKPENVSYDVTVPLDANSSDLLPVVFQTGFKIAYVPGANAVPLTPPSKDGIQGMAIFYHGNNSIFKADDRKPDGIVMEVISTNFHDPGKNYQQLTPTGPLSP